MTSKIPAYQIAPGDIIAGHKVTNATIHERHEWLTVIVEREDCETHRYSYYDTVEVTRLPGPKFFKQGLDSSP
jgi:hypothetical protein